MITKRQTDRNRVQYTAFDQETAQWARAQWRTLVKLPHPSQVWPARATDFASGFVGKLRQKEIIARVGWYQPDGCGPIGLYRTDTEAYRDILTFAQLAQPTDAIFPCGCGEAIENRAGERGVRCGHCETRYVERDGDYIRAGGEADD